MHSTISTDYVVNARYTVMGITRSTLHAARPRKRQGASLPLAQALPSAGGLRPDERARGRCMIRQAQRGDAAPGRQYQCNTNVCQVFALRPHTNQRIRRDNATLAPVAPACVALRRCLPASLPASLPACVASQATLHQSGRDAAPRDAAPVRASQGGGRRWPSQGKSGRRDAKSGQVRAMEKPRKSGTCAKSGPQSGAGSVARTPHGGRSAGGRMILTPQQGVAQQISRTRKIPGAVKISA